MTRLAILGVGVLLGLLLATDAFAWGAVSGPRGGAVYRGPYGGGYGRGPAREHAAHGWRVSGIDERAFMIRWTAMIARRH